MLAPAGREATLYRIGAGDSCLPTTSALMGDEPLPAEGWAETDVEARIVARAAFERLVAEDPPFRRDVLRNYANRVADLVVTIRARCSARSPSGWRGPFSRAKAEGSSKRRIRRWRANSAAREVVTRVAQPFEREGLIAVERGRIVIRDRDALRRMAAGEP
ncbi:CRP/FNR family transcriptional regulator [Roseiarcus fermentans]|uniref:CRP/FNR family transcriptional regulator n=2 Tax=Roseiarcus fermentans TaxID=1473586 RepID=A0A366F9C0_9HYPH|nr:CRP/FNR family transcriptional regulator [Roseiarcus fermentans]